MSKTSTVIHSDPQFSTVIPQSNLTHSPFHSYYPPYRGGITVELWVVQGVEESIPQSTSFPQLEASA